MHVEWRNRSLLAASIPFALKEFLGIAALDAVEVVAEAAAVAHYTAKTVACGVD